uniref:Uncharacterized protein n=1 Tax=Anguilla anguilla TaxID=7936 RepID=A0A0E9U7Z5_ANGAN
MVSYVLLTFIISSLYLQNVKHFT